MLKIYFAHSVKDYDSKYEQKCIKKILNTYPNAKIMNPNTDINIIDQDEAKIKGKYNEFMGMMGKYFFNAISECDIVCPFIDNKSKKYSQGVVMEIQYAKSVDIKVSEIGNKRTVFGKKITKIFPSKKDRIHFYKNSNAFDFINDFFDVQKGVRYVVGHVENRVERNRQPTYRLWKNETCKPIRFLPVFDENDSLLIDYYCNHTYIYTFKDHKDKCFPNIDRIKMFEDYELGINAFLDLDMPEDPEGKNAKRLNFFDHIDEFNVVLSKIDKILKKNGEKYNLMFSGNGIYVLFQGYYEDNLDEYVENMKNLIDHLKESELGDKSKVHVCNTRAPWNDYHKLPFTFHETRPRMSLPLKKGKLDGEWLNRVSNVNNVMKDYNIINEIIKKCRWEKLW